MDNKKIKLISSTLDDVFSLENRLRLADINEVEALGSNPHKALLMGYIYSDECMTVWEDDKVIGMFGVSNWDLPKGFATIWFLGSDECRNHPVTFVKEGIKYTKKSLQKYDILVNCVDARNTDSLRWLRAIGMNLSSAIDVKGNKFIQFYKVKGV